MELIDKSALVAEIERRIKEHHSGYLVCLKDILQFIDTLEVKEVDLKKEYEEYVVYDPILGNFIINDTMGMILAKHFFELGLKAKEEDKLDKAIKLADAMYDAAQRLTTDASWLHKAMQDWWKFKNIEL